MTINAYKNAAKRSHYMVFSALNKVPPMYPVRIFSSTGKLKKTVDVKTLSRERLRVESLKHQGFGYGVKDV